MKGLKTMAWGVLSLAAPHLYASTSQRPNIILINIDDLGWTDLACNGSGYYETPHIDKLRSLGIWFSQAYAGASNSAPSRACMLTGQYSPRHGIYTVGNPDRGNLCRMAFRFLRVFCKKPVTKLFMWGNGM